MTHVSPVRRIALAVGLVAASLALTADGAHAITLEHDGFEPSTRVVVLIGANDYGYTAPIGSNKGS